MQIKTFEAIGIGHPDRMADIIAEITVDHFRALSRQGPAGIEVLTSDTNVFVVGEVCPQLAKYQAYDQLLLTKKINDFLREQGYRDMAVHTRFKPQSREINEVAHCIGDHRAADQSIIVGYATDETPQRLPMGQVFANKVMQRVNDVQKAHHCLQDAKIMVEMIGDSVHDIWISAHAYKDKEKEVRTDILNAVKDCLTENDFKDFNHMDTKLTTFSTGGLHADTGTTNRKLVSTTYGPNVLCGGGGLHGKDMGKVDRLGFYFARFIAKSLVDTGFFKEIELQLVYSFGSELPRIIITKADTGPYKYKTPFNLNLFVNEKFKVIFHELWLTFLEYEGWNYEKTARLGHFLNVMPWEKTAAKAGELLNWFKENKTFII